MAADPEETILPDGSRGSMAGDGTVFRPEAPGDRIGPYKLLSPIGEGGFGTVWLAERREPFVQRVALKLIKAGMDSKVVLARFEQERQALALMDHPNIAHVLDGGLTPQGRPYFAMEFVKGEPITDFCDARRLSVRARLELFAQVCDAVQHSHLRCIVHRDLKPSNILAFDLEGEAPRVKVIDFGVAKAMSHPLTDKSIFTETGRMIGTHAYMSPEQADPSVAGIDTRSDVYSLGVLLYELVAGAPPFDPRELRSKAYGEIQRILREEDPPSPSARLSTIGTADADLAGHIGRSRGVALRQLARDLQGELEWIPLKAMRKEPMKRYQSALDLRRDVENYLAGRPVSAGPDSAAYRLRKWMRRNRAWMRAAVLVMSTVAAVVGYRWAVGAFHEWRETRRMHDFEVLERDPDPGVVTDADARDRMRRTGLPWKLRHSASGIVMLLVPPGEFLMGSPEGESGRKANERQHRRVIGSPFYLSRLEVSNDEWARLAGSPAGQSFGAGLPAEGVSWFTVHDRFLAAARGALRLPSEAEWEYACRAGSMDAYSFGGSITREQVHFNAERPVSCGSLPSNPWGFHEMHGNVLEWVADRYRDYPESGGGQAPAEPASSERFDNMGIARGGAWASPPAQCRSACRIGGADFLPLGTTSCTGFRVAMSPDR